MNEYIQCTEIPEHTYLEITGNVLEGTVLVDTADVPLLQKHSWYIKAAAQENHNHYIAAKINSKTTKIHRFLMNVKDRSILVDHKNRNTFDNRRENLRKASYSQNNLNIGLRKTNTSGTVGVRYKEGLGTRSSSWEASLRIENKRYVKQFSVDKFGYDNAHQMAIEYRKDLEKKFNVFIG